MTSRKFYEEMFKPYPDVVMLLQFRKMLGDIADSTTRKLVQENHVEHFYIKEKLIAKGIAPEEIAFIHDAKNEAQKKEIVAKVCAGAIRVLMGSTSKMGVGMNAQYLLVASHDLDCPWRPWEVGQFERAVWFPKVCSARNLVVVLYFGKGNL